MAASSIAGTPSLQPQPLQPPSPRSRPRQSRPRPPRQTPGATALRSAGRLLVLATALVVALTLVHVPVVTGRDSGAAQARTYDSIRRANLAVKYALAKRGAPYVWGATGPWAFDCSGLTYAAYRYAGISIPRRSRDQYLYLRKTYRSRWVPGDLVFWGSNTRDGRSVYHVAIYIGNNTVVHAPYPGQRVRAVRVWTYGLMPYVARPAWR